MLRIFQKALSLSLITGLIFLGISCTKEYEVSGPHSGSYLSNDIATLQKLYADREYDNKLNPSQNNQLSLTNTWKWNPLWDQAIKKISTGSDKYVYVPLEPRVPTQPHTVILVGSRRYLCIKINGNRFEFNIVTYIYDENKLNKEKYNNPLWMNSFYSMFTGTIIMKNLDTNKEFYFAYNEGEKTQQKITKIRDVSKYQNESNEISNCQYYYTCYWSGYCTSNYTT